MSSNPSVCFSLTNLLFKMSSFRACMELVSRSCIKFFSVLLLGVFTVDTWVLFIHLLIVDESSIGNCVIIFFGT